MKDHLLHPLADGGHGLSTESLEVWTDYERVHEDDHRPGNWFADALLHNHEAAP